MPLVLWSKSPIPTHEFGVKSLSTLSGKPQKRLLFLWPNPQVGDICGGRKVVQL